MFNGNAATRLILAIAAFGSFALLSHAQTNISPPRSAAAGYRVSGIVVSKIDGHPLDRVRVLLRDSKTRNEPESLLTSEDGKFAFEHLSASKYSLEGVKIGFVSAAYEQHDQYSTAIVTGAGIDTENLVLRLSPEAVIAGRVIDEAGEPVRPAIVMLYRSDHSQGADQIHMFRSTQTNDLGQYELTSLSPGTYFLSVRAEPWYAVHPPSSTDPAQSGRNSGTHTNVDPSLDVAYPLTYYENATETDDATPIEVVGGEHLQIETQLTPVPALRLIYHAPGNPGREFTMPQLEQPAFDGVTNVQVTPVFLSPGVVELTGIPAGRYNIRIPGQKTVSQMNGIDLSKDGEELDTSGAEALSSVKVSVKVAAERSVPDMLAVGLVQARTAVGGFHPISAKGEAEIDQVPAGSYEVQVLGGGKQYLVVGLSADGVQFKGHTVTVPAGASATVALTLAVGIDIQGVAKKAGKPFAEAMIVLVPKDPAENHDLFRRDQSDLDGTFTLHNVPPGSYTLVAIENGWDLDWSRPEVIAGYVKRGQSVVVSQTSRSVQVKDAVEVLSK